MQSLPAGVGILDPLRPEPFCHRPAIGPAPGRSGRLRWSSVGILSQAWPQEKNGVEQTAYLRLQAEIDRLKAENRKSEAAELKAELDTALVRDVTITVSWTGERRR